MAYENTHIYAAEQIRSKIESLKLRNILDGNLTYYHFGAIFPDICFFGKERQIRSISDNLHGVTGTPTNRAVFTTLAWLNENQDPKVLAFILGFLTHLAMDTTVHPVIYYFSEYKADGGPQDHKKSAYLHWHYETYLDQRFNRQYYLDELVSVKTAKALGISRILNIPEAGLIRALERQIAYFSRVRSRFLFHCYRLMHVFGMVEKKYLGGFYPNLELDTSVLPEHLVYQDLISGEPRETTLDQLMSDGIASGRRMIESAYQYYCGDITRKACEKVVDGSNLDTGRVGKLVSDIRFSHPA